MSDILDATYTIYCRDRYTKALIPGSDFTGRNVDGSYRRRFKTYSTAELLWNIGSDCCDFYPVKMEHELVIERHGTDDTTPWVGPIIEVRRDTDLGTMEIEAADRSWWWTRRQAFQVATTVTNVDAAEAWAAVRADQDRTDPSGLSVIAEPVGRLTSFTAPQFGSTEFELSFLDDVAWTVTGETLRGPGATTLGAITYGALDTDRDWDTNSDGVGGSTVVDTAEPTSTHVVVIGLDVVGVYPAVAEPSDRGYHLARVDRPDLTTVAQCTQLAETLWRRNLTGGLYLTTKTSTLRRGGPYTIADYECGRRFTIETSVLCDRAPLVADVELQQLVVKFGTDQGRIRELSVGVDMGPIGVTFPVDELTV